MDVVARLSFFPAQKDLIYIFFSKSTFILPKYPLPLILRLHCVSGEVRLKKGEIKNFGNFISKVHQSNQKLEAKRVARFAFMLKSEKSAI